MGLLVWSIGKSHDKIVWLLSLKERLQKGIETRNESGLCL